MITYIKKSSRDAKASILKDYSKNCWVKVVDPNEEEISFLIERFKLDRDLFIDGLDIFENPRLENEEGKSYVFLRSPVYQSVAKQEGAEDPLSSFLVVLNNDFFITVSKKNLEIFDSLQKNRYFSAADKFQCLFFMLSYISRSFNINVRDIFKNLKRDMNKFSELGKKDLKQLVIQEHLLNEYLSSFSLLADVYHRIFKYKNFKFTLEQREEIEDLLIDLSQTFGTCKIALKSISNMREYYSANLSNKINDSITVLTIFTIFLTIPTLISSIYGMNIMLPFQNSVSLLPSLVGIIVVLWLGIFLIFKKFGII